MVFAFSPSTTGRICVVLGSVEMPCVPRRLRRRSQFASSRSRRHGSSSIKRSAARAASTWAGASAQEKMKLRAVFTSRSRSLAEPATKAPKDPIDLPRVPIRMSTSPRTPASSAVPRPRAPRQPVPCASSRSTIASASCACFTISATGATSPSML